MMSASERYTQLEAAISAIENGAQEYRIGSRSVRKADLSVLYAERKNLERQIAEENGYNTAVAVFDGR